MTRRMPVVTASMLCAVLFAMPCSRAMATDWPTFRKDNERSGITDERLAVPLTRVWTFTTRFAPKPAYGTGFPKSTNWEGGVEKRRIDFDRADSVVVAGGKAYLGSVGDGKVYCLDPASGSVVWTFLTGGPIRLAPSVADGRVYAGSDDGWVYCLNAADGSLVWSFRGAPEDHRVIGNGRLVSLWPIRTGVMIDNGIAYFGAGIFPSEGVYLYAVDAKTGKLIWRNDKGAGLRFAQISPQGYLLATGDRLIVPMARQAPQICDKLSGEYLNRLSIYFGGGTFAALRDGVLLTGWESAKAFRLERALKQNEGTSENIASFPGGQLVAAPGAVYSCGFPRGEGASKSVVAFKWTIPAESVQGAKDKPASAGPVEWWTSPFDVPESIVLAGDTLFVGGPGAVSALNASDGTNIWTEKIEGSALSLTVSGGRLYVSTDKGCIHCFAAKGARVSGEVSVPVEKGIRVASPFSQASEAILKLAPGARKGFALVYGVETGELALQLARHTDMMVYAVSPDEKKVAAARKLLDSAGFYGVRVVVQQWPLEKVPYTKYLADLVVSETALVTGKMPGKAEEVFRMTKPVRGTVIVGGPSADAEALKAWLAESAMATAKIATDSGTWAIFTRPPLAGAKAWTDQYGGPGATGSSEDDLVRAPLRIQWWGDPGPENYVDRHYWGAAPLAYEGRMYYCSYKNVTAYDVYTGNTIWSYTLENAVRSHLADVPGNAVVGKDGYFVAVDDVCRRLDPATGALLKEYKVPDAGNGQRRMWGYVACQDGVLVGSRTLGYVPLSMWRKTRQFDHIMCSDLLFGMDINTGQVLWSYPVQWFRHNCVVIGDSVVYLSHPGVTPEEGQQAADEIKKWTGKGEPPAKSHIELLTALDLKTGKPKWQRGVEWALCGGDRGTLIYKNDLLLQLTDVGGCKAFNGYNPTNYIGKGPWISARNGKTGEVVWFKSMDYRSRAVVVGDTIIAEPWAYNLKTAEQKMVEHPITGAKTPWLFERPAKHCGPFNASAHALFFRSEGFGYYDMLRDEGVAHFDSNRPNCWTSFISAEGVALWPTSDSGCRCGIAIQCSLALIHDEESRVYADFTTIGPLTPVKRLALNLGAPGDRRDADGLLWLGYPRRQYIGALGVLGTNEFYKGGDFVQCDWSRSPVKATATPWVCASAANGLKRLSIPVRRKEDGKAAYNVQLVFAAPLGDKVGSRVFDVLLQGRQVRKSLDIVKEAGEPDKALTLKFDRIEAGEDITLDLVSAEPNPSPAQWPVINAIVVSAE